MLACRVVSAAARAVASLASAPVRAVISEARPDSRALTRDLNDVSTSTTNPVSAEPVTAMKAAVP